jgi:putative endonuclease
MGHTREIGQAAEKVAENYFIKRGFGLVARNFRTKGSEIDLVLERAGLLLFVEVKGRKGDWEPHAWNPQWQGKRRRLRAAMREFMGRNPECFDRADEFGFEIVFVTQGRVVACFREA